MAEDGRTLPLPWGNILSGFGAFVAAVGLVAGIGTMRLAPIDKHIDALDGEIVSINTLMAPLLTLNAQHTADLATIVELRKTIESKLDKNVFDVTEAEATNKYNQNKADFIRTLEEITHQVHDIEGEIVTRAEHTQQTAEISERITSLERRVDALTLLVENNKTRDERPAK